MKDAEKKEHPCFMPYDGLPMNQRLKDYIFAAICEAFFRAPTEPSLASSAADVG